MLSHICVNVLVHNLGLSSVWVWVLGLCRKLLEEEDCRGVPWEGARRCPVEPGPLPATAEPIRWQRLWDSIIKKGNRAAMPQLLEVWSENIWRTALQTSRSVKKEGQDVLQALELRFPAACRGAPCWSRGCLKETVELWGIHIAVVCEELQPMARTHFGKVYGGPAIIRWNRRQVWEGRSDTDVRWSYYNSHSTSLCAAWGRKMQTHEWNWAWKEGISERKVFQDLGLFLIILFWFYC